MARAILSEISDDKDLLGLTTAIAEDEICVLSEAFLFAADSAAGLGIPSLSP
jgi:hypothetical protein